MAIKSDYISGTLTITQGSTAFSGTGTGWESAGFKEGDTLIDITGATEYMGVIEAITGERAGILTKAWEGPSLVDVPYRMRYQPDGARSTAQARNLIEILGNGNITAFATLQGSANAIPYFTGPGAMALLSKQDLTSGAAYDIQVDTLAQRAAYDGQDAGYTVLVSDVGDGRSAIYSKNSATAGDWSAPAYITTKSRTSLVVWDVGNPGSGELIWTSFFDTEITFPSNFAGSYSRALSPPSNTAVYSIRKNGTQFGTITFNPGNGNGVFNSTTTTFEEGDIISIIAPNPRDTTLEGIAITLAGSR